MSQPTFIAPPPEMLGDLLPAYEFEMLIAVGGMGAVYKARQRSLDRDVAIKILPKEMSGDPEFRASFETEARAMARLNHPNLIGVYDSGTVAGMLYIVMEYVAGKPLYYSSYGRQIEPGQAIQLIQGICAGLGHAHENGIIHRDIKPANILLTPRAEPKIGDFGLARPADAVGEGLAMGTVGYAAPEIMSNPTEADRRSDLYAVGVILYELLTGARQEPGAQPPSQLAEVDARMDAIWRRATHPNPELRYPDAQAFQSALSDWTSGKSAAAPAAGRRAALVTAGPNRAAAAAAGPAPASVSTANFAPRTNWPLARNLLIIAALVVITVVVWSNLQVARADRERENAAMIEKNRNRSRLAAEEAARAAAAANEQPTRPGTASGGGTITPGMDVAEETPAQSMLRLRAALVGGSRIEMPIGTLPYGEGFALRVDIPKTWSEAAEMAEEYGGHLLVVNSPEQLDWVSQNAPEAGAWIGAGRSGRAAWSHVDGQSWALPSEPRGSGTYAAVNSLGLVRATLPGEPLPFFIQWQPDSSIPGSLKSSLAATGKSLAAESPVYPPGTAALQDRHFLLVLRTVNAMEAAELAELAGGHLATPATPDEAEFLAEMCASLKPVQTLWLGGNREGDHWIWNTGETWNSASWIDNAADTSANSALILRPTQGWDAASPSETAAGFIIEWSPTTGSEPGTETPMPEVGGVDIASLTTRASELVMASVKKRDAAHAENTRSFTWELDTWIRGLSKGDQEKWQEHVDALKEATETDGRVPASALPGVPLSPQMAKVSEHRAGKQKEIDAAFLSEAEKIRASYHTKVAEALAAATAAGQRSLATSIEGILSDAADLDSWLAALGMTTDSGTEADDDSDAAFVPSEMEEEDDDVRGRDAERLREIERLRRRFFERD